jgi:hypothetical protein
VHTHTHLNMHADNLPSVLNIHPRPPSADTYGTPRRPVSIIRTRATLTDPELPSLFSTFPPSPLSRCWRRCAGCAGARRVRGVCACAFPMLALPSHTPSSHVWTPLRCATGQLVGVQTTDGNTLACDAFVAAMGAWPLYIWVWTGVSLCRLHATLRGYMLLCDQRRPLDEHSADLGVGGQPLGSVKSNRPHSLVE